MTGTLSPVSTRAARIHDAFQKASAEGRAAFIPYMTAGYPSPERYVETALTLLSRADLLEVGLPYSDPLGDGPTIQRASEAALRAGVSTLQTFEFIRQLRAQSDKPLLLMTYINPVYALGPERFIQLAVESGVDGLILPDLPPDEDDEIRALATANGLTLTFLIAPTSTPARVKLVVEACTGFVYAVSVVGITGAREGSALGEVPALVELAKQYTELPVAVGFGVKDRATAQLVAQVADGVVVGSAFINALDGGQELQAVTDDIAGGCVR